MVTNFDINVYIIARKKGVLKRPGTVRCPADLLQRRSGAVRHLTVPGRASADVSIYRRRSAPLRYVTTQEKIAMLSSDAVFVRPNNMISVDRRIVYIF